MGHPFESSLSDEATFAGVPKRRPASEVSIGDDRTLGANRSGQDTVIDDIEVVDLEARYKIEGTLGQGGMGAVLLATDTRLDRKVAIKRILGEAARSKTAIMRFLTEAKAIAALNHPNIVQIYDYGRAKDGPFLIMEFVDEGSLLDRCRESALPLDEAIALACQLCDGLAKAHDLGIVHRDIKPANVLLTKDGIPKLTDFGLAKAQASDQGQTMTGAVLGTPDFMPPEQRRDASLVDHRSDLWSLAATVYQMVTGRSPKIIRFKDVPESIQEVLGKALEDAKDARYQSAREFRDALKAGLRSAVPMTAVASVSEGQCPSCSAHNDASRKFCRGCGESLEAPCLSCSKPMPMWEEICGACGTKQTPLADERRKTMAASQAEAEGLLGDLEFDRAAAVASTLRDEAHPKLRHLSLWAEGFLKQIESARAELERQAVEAIVEADKHEAAHDYLSAHFALENVPERLRTVVLPCTTESAARMLDRVERLQSEVRRLELLLKERLAAKQYDGLLPEVEKLLELQPDLEDVKKIRLELIERRKKLVAGRDEALRKAAALIEAHDYEAAVATLAGVANAAISTEVTKLRDRAESLASEVRELAAAIRRADLNTDGLLTSLDRYLKLKPADVEFVTLKESIVKRQQAIAEERRSLATQAKKLVAEYRYEEAVSALDGMSTQVETPALRQFRSQARNALDEVDSLRAQIKAALADKSLDGLIDTVNRYLRLSPNDSDARALMHKLSAREDELRKDFVSFCTNAQGMLDAGNWQETLAAVRQRKPRPQETFAWNQLLSKANAARDAEYVKALAARARQSKAWGCEDRTAFLALPFLFLLFSGIVLLISTAGVYFVPAIAILQSAWSWSLALSVGSGICLVAMAIGHFLPFPSRVSVEIAVGVAAFGIIVTLGGDRVLQQGSAAAFFGPWLLSLLPIAPFVFTNIDGRIARLESFGAGAGDVVFPGVVLSCPNCGNHQFIVPGTHGHRVQCLKCKNSYKA
jgi:serine/threonine protein kinase